jgi:hypothetical protein
VWLLTTTAAVVTVAIVAAVSGIGMAMCLVILTLAPVVTVVGCARISAPGEVVAG